MENEKNLSDVQNIAPDAAAVSPQPYDIPLDELLSGGLKKRSPEEEKKLKRNIAIGVGVALFMVAFIVYALQPAKGSMAYGICSTFLELHTNYPHTLNYTGLEGSQTAIRIYFTNVDAFGQFKQEMIECTFAADEKLGMRLSRVARNRKPVDRAIVDKFNQTLPIITASDPYRVHPPYRGGLPIPEFWRLNETGGERYGPLADR